MTVQNGTPATCKQSLQVGRETTPADEAQREADKWAERAEQYKGTPVGRSFRVRANSWAKMARKMRDAE